MIVPALIAMGEKHGGPGRKFLEAAVVGYETIIRIGLCHRRAETFRARLVAKHDLRRVRRRGGGRKVFGFVMSSKPSMRSALLHSIAAA